MAIFGNFFNKLKNVFGGELIGTAAGTVSGKMISELIGMPAKKITEIALDKMFQVPPRAELQKVLLGLNDTQRKFWEARFEEAKKYWEKRLGEDNKNLPHRPSENEVVTAWCKPLLLKKVKVLLKKSDGTPILNKGVPVFAESESDLVSDDDLRAYIYGKVADIGEKEFWIWTDLLIHDKWNQIFQIWGDKFKIKILNPIIKRLQETFEVIVKYSAIATAAGKVSLEKADTMTEEMIAESKNKKLNIF